ncbi:hypothetical protein NL676_037078 [Syzygium grande]|nr:hypothetical protein NL676_037078 [Syzygium grande]
MERAKHYGVLSLYQQTGRSESRRVGGSDRPPMIAPPHTWRDHSSSPSPARSRATKRRRSGYSKTGAVRCSATGTRSSPSRRPHRNASITTAESPRPRGAFAPSKSTQSTVAMGRGDARVSVRFGKTFCLWTSSDATRNAVTPPSSPFVIFSTCAKMTQPQSERYDVVLGPREVPLLLLLLVLLLLRLRSLRSNYAQPPKAELGKESEIAEGLRERKGR